MGNVVAMKLDLRARDATGQRRYAVKAVERDTTVRELVQGLVGQMGLPSEDATGTPQIFHAFLERDGRHLHSAETVGEALEDGDELILHPDVQAG